MKGPPQFGPDAVCKEMIRHWCEAMEDGNPLYTDSAYAEDSRFRGIIAPPQMVQAWTMGPLWPDGQQIHWRRPEPGPITDADPVLAAFMRFNQAGYIGTFVATTAMEFFRPLFPGDRVSRATELIGITPEKKTRTGAGHFITFRLTNANQNGELVCRQALTMLKYKPAQQPV